MLKPKLVLRIWLTVVLLLLLGTTVWWIAACFTIPQQIALHRRHLWALFVINYEDRVIDLLFAILILLSWVRARQIFYRASMIYLAHSLGESVAGLSDAHFQMFSMVSLPPFVHYYLLVHGVIGALLFLGLAGIRRSAAEHRIATLAKPTVVVLAILLYLGDTFSAWHHLYARLFDVPWLSMVQRRLPHVLVADSFRLLLYNLLYASALWLTRPDTDSPMNGRPVPERREAVFRAR